MTTAEKKAFEYGRTFVPDSADKDAPCYDVRMFKTVINAKSKQGSDYNVRVLRAWWAGRKAAGFDVPKWWYYGV